MEAQTIPPNSIHSFLEEHQPLFEPLGLNDIHSLIPTAPGNAVETSLVHRWEITDWKDKVSRKDRVYSPNFEFNGGDTLAVFLDSVTAASKPKDSNWHMCLQFAIPGTKAFAFVSFGLVAVLKCIIFTVMFKQPYFLWGIPQFPGLFFLDLLVYRILTILLQSNLVVWHILILGILLPIQSWIASMFLCYYFETGNFADWFAMQGMDLETLHQFAEAFRKQLFWVIVMCVGLVAFQVVGALIFTTRRGPRRGERGWNYQSIDKKVDDAESGLSGDECERTAAKSSAWRSGWWFKLFVVAAVCNCFIESGTGIARLSENFLVSPALTFLWRDVQGLFEEDFLAGGRVPRQTHNFRYNTTVYPSTAEAKLENVVVIFRESLRADILDFNATLDSHLASVLLNKSHVVDFDTTFSPFLNRLKNKSLFFPSTQSASGYTIKSIRSAMCGIYPVKGRHYEYKRSIYAPCLPHLLPNHTSRFYYPGQLDFDHFTETIAQIGFNSTFSIEDLNVTRSEWLNYFGVDDRRELSDLSEFLDSQVATNGSFMMGLLDNAGHHPFAVPEGYVSQRFAADDRINSYLNAVNNVDAFLEEVFAAFGKHKGLLESTLFVIVGDHGMGLGDHGGVVGTGEGGFEESFRVPLMFYSENPAFHRDWTRRVDPLFPASSIDLLPTVLDFLGLAEILDTSAHEGQSLLRPMSEHRALYSVSNPSSNHAQVFVEDHFKLKLEVNANVAHLFDSRRDPLEQHEILKGRYTTEERDWVKHARNSIREIDLDVDRKFGPYVN
ncbi:hypothetical protein HDU98_007883 [Podochytrium sp. JEL0797]|nr:hypothetical protein HDU98_007883 [Podochytrium sp. JEL0797]